MSNPKCSDCIYECKNKNNKGCWGFTPAEDPSDDDYIDLVEEHRCEYFDAWQSYSNQYSENFVGLTQFNNV